MKGCRAGMQFSAFESEGLEFGLEDWVGDLESKMCG